MGFTQRPIPIQEYPDAFGCISHVITEDSRELELVFSARPASAVSYQQTEKKHVIDAVHYRVTAETTASGSGSGSGGGSDDDRFPSWRLVKGNAGNQTLTPITGWHDLKGPGVAENTTYDVPILEAAVDGAANVVWPGEAVYVETDTDVGADTALQAVVQMYCRNRLA